MASSRTGTARWQRVRKQRLDHDRDAGITRCPRCRTGLDWTRTQQPNSPEPDHIIPWDDGGPDTFENTRTICRRCNGQLGALYKQSKKRARPTIETTELPTTIDW